MQEILKTQNRLQEKFCAYLEVTHPYQLIGCARNKYLFRTFQRNLKLFLLMLVSAWIEFQVLISGIRLLKCCILLPTNSQDTTERAKGDLLRDTSSSKHTNIQTNNPIRHDDLELCNVDYVSSNVKSSQFGAMLYTFEDNEVVIKMIIKGRSPKMRHVSRTHRVAFDWLFDRFNLDLKVQITYVDTKHQLAGIDRSQFHT